MPPSQLGFSVAVCVRIQLASNNHPLHLAALAVDSFFEGLHRPILRRA
jgi:hypothetical protein